MKTCEATSGALSHYSDELLAQRAAAADLEAFEELLRRYRRRVFRICYRMAANAEDAEDWAQECFVRVFRQLGSYNSRLPFAPWVLRVVSNTCVNLAQARSRHGSRLELGVDAEDIAVSPRPGPERELTAREELRTARAAIDGLPPLLRQALALRVEEELSFREVADVLGVPLQTAAARVRRALLQLRRALGVGGEE